ncbi:MAG: D-amino acid aminotransferase [Pseudomonadota bacterium]
MSTAYLNGEFLPLDEARVPVMDRGFLFGDGVYEVIPVYGGKLFRLAHHLKRLANSLNAIRIGNPMTDDDWRVLLEQVVERNDGGDCSVYLQVTRGIAAKRDHAFPAGVAATVFIMTSPMSSGCDIDNEQGIHAITLDDIRWDYCNVKAITLLPNVLLRQQAVDAQAAEAVLIKDGLATEGAASNLFIVRHGLLITPPKGPSLLPGITRDLILELAANHGIPFREADITLEDLDNADEIWLTSSTREISPVTLLDDRTINDGTPGTLWARMIRIYQEYKDAVRAGEAT